MDEIRMPSQNNNNDENISSISTEKNIEAKPLDTNNTKEDEKPQIQEMTLSDLFSAEEDKQKKNERSQNQDRENKPAESQPKKSIFIAPEPIEPKNMNQAGSKSFGDDLSKSKSRSQSTSSDNKELKLPENIFSDSEEKSSGGSIFGNIFGSSNKKKSEDSPKEVAQQNKEKPEAASIDKDELDIPAFLRRKSD